MLRDSSNAEADTKVHWTQTPAGRKRMAKIRKKAMKTLKARRADLTRARDRVGKRDMRRLDVVVLAKRLQRMVDERVREEGLSDFAIAAHTLVQAILGE